MSGQKNDRKLAVLLNFSNLLKYFHVDANFLVDALKGLVQSPSHRSHYWHLYFCNQIRNQLFGFKFYQLFRLIGRNVETLDAFFHLQFNGLKNSAGRQNFSLERVHRPNRHTGVKGPFQIAKIIVLRMKFQEVGILFEWLFSILFQNVFLDAIIINSDVFSSLDICNVDVKLFALL